MDFASIEKQALGLPDEDRARLAQELLGSLETLSPEDHRPFGWMKRSGARRKSTEAKRSPKQPRTSAERRERFWGET